MKITSFDELQREITKLTSELKTLRDSYSASSLDSRTILIYVDSLKNLSMRVGQLWMANLGDLYKTNSGEAERYGKRIGVMDRDIRNDMTAQCGKLDALADIDAAKTNTSPPKWYGEFSAHITNRSMRGHWTYGLDPISLLNDQPTYKLYYRIDLYDILVYTRDISRSAPYYGDTTKTPAPTDAKITKSLNNAFKNNDARNRISSYYTNMSLWVDIVQPENFKIGYGSYTGSDKVAMSSLEALHPPVDFRSCYSLRSLFDNFSIARQ